MVITEAERKLNLLPIVVCFQVQCRGHEGTTCLKNYKMQMTKPSVTNKPSLSPLWLTGPATFHLPSRRPFSTTASASSKEEGGEGRRVEWREGKGAGQREGKSRQELLTGMYRTSITLSLNHMYSTNHTSINWHSPYAKYTKVHPHQ